ncbi:MAG TPA: oligoendopeptidase F [Alphaproteobacteria bacterium]|jgi:oligoendopeptidase F|nr:oligoendopeptidase F [Alphaproteobacteria bacterium]HCA15032.1 oligoendopeptidase F [Alphaproteobacteria bacterium]HCD80325.1 oligoendopeptidase F [Alphaproteobacteria bacterium]|tara:strand:+ start:4442 stop:6220 length:1779 start_codon:yes stop_codon:yes gene_type:complete
MPDSCPTWDLTDLYEGIGDDAIAADLARCRREAERMESAWQGKIGNATPQDLATLIADYEQVLEALGKAQSHAQLLFAASTTDAQIARHHQSIREASADIGARLLFVELEIAALPSDHVDRLLETAEFAAWQPWLRRVRAFAPHQLSPDMERMLAERAPSGRGAWVRLFDETAAGLRFPFGDAEVTEAEVLNKLSSPDADERREAGASLSQTLKANERLLSLVLNTIAKDKEVEDRWRGFARPVASRNLDNDVDDQTVDALVAAVDDRNADLSHRYYRLKAGWMGGDTLNWWDRNAPLPSDDDRKFSWDEARQLVLASFDGFDPQMAAQAEPFFTRNWIDAEPRAGKSSGAFSHPVTPSAHPYILMNFSGKSRDVMTLAHEMGHGIHQRLAADRGYLMSDTPLTLAETASVFAEMLTFRRLVDSTDDPAIRQRLLAGKVEDMLNTVVRQVAFHNFETRFHDARRNAELTSDEISDIWMETQRAALGPAIKTGDDYRPIWGYIPHFVHTPFYVYAYAFGDCLVNALWQTYQSAQADGQAADFVASYRSLLQAGGTERYDIALQRFGLDPRDPAFWSMGLDMISGMIDELEGLS